MNVRALQRRREITGFAWLGTGLACFIFVNTLVKQLLDVQALTTAFLVAFVLPMFIVLRGPLRLRLFLKSKNQTRGGLVWLAYCVGIAVLVPLTTWALSRAFIAFGI